MADVISLQLKRNFDSAGVVIPDTVSWEFVENYREEHIISKLRDAEILYCGPSYPYIGEPIIEKCKHLKLIQSSGAGFDSVDTKTAAKYGIPVANSPGQNSNSVVEQVLAQIIILLRNLHIADTEIKKGNYEKSRIDLISSGIYEIRDLNIGVVGTGNIGVEICKMCKILGGHVSYFDVNRLSRDRETELGITFLEFDELIKVSDVVIVQVPRMKSTIDLIGEKELSAMKKTAIIINSARGGIINEEDLARALENGEIRGASIDNFNSEIPEKNNPLLRLSESATKRVFFTPHIGGMTRQAINRMFNQSVKNAIGTLDGNKPDFVVNGVL